MQAAGMQDKASKDEEGACAVFDMSRAGEKNWGSEVLKEKELRQLGGWG